MSNVTTGILLSGVRLSRYSLYLTRSSHTLPIFSSRCIPFQTQSQYRPSLKIAPIADAKCLSYFRLPETHSPCSNGSDFCKCFFNSRMLGTIPPEGRMASNLYFTNSSVRETKWGFPHSIKRADVQLTKLYDEQNQKSTILCLFCDSWRLACSGRKTTFYTISEDCSFDTLSKRC